MIEAVVCVLATLVLYVVLRQQAVLERRVQELERRVPELEAVAHPPVDLRPLVGPLMRPMVRAEVERVLEEHVS